MFADCVSQPCSGQFELLLAFILRPSGVGFPLLLHLDVGLVTICTLAAALFCASGVARGLQFGFKPFFIRTQSPLFLIVLFLLLANVVLLLLDLTICQ